jgi:hypothetical protein
MVFFPAPSLSKSANIEVSSFWRVGGEKVFATALKMLLKSLTN